MRSSRQRRTPSARRDWARLRNAGAGSEGARFDRDFYGPVMEGLFRCSRLALGDRTCSRAGPFNVPGTATSSNWSRRMWKTVEGLKQSRRVKQRMRLISELLEKTGRL